jgi:hypothetical protein
MNGQPDDHGQIAVGLATAIAHKISEVMPAVEKHLRDGDDRHGLTANIMFRLGQPGRGEGQVVASVEFSMTTGEYQQFMLAPSPVSGQLAIVGQPQQATPPPGMNGGQHPNLPQDGTTPYPSAQFVPDRVPQPLQPRGQLAPPNAGQALTSPPDSLVSGPMPQYRGDPTPYIEPAPQPQVEIVPPGTSTAAAPVPQMTPDQYAQWHLQQYGTVPAPPIPAAPQPQPQKPVRLRRPLLADEGGIR